MELTLAQCCVGLNVITGKFLIVTFPVFLLLAIRFAIGLRATLAVTRYQGLKAFHIYRNFISLSSKDKFLLILQGLCGGFLFNVFILYGMKSTSATSAGIISSITPIMIFVLAAIFLGEKISLQKGIAILIAVAGLIVLSGGGIHSIEGTLLGNFLVFLAVIPEAFFTILSKSIGKKISETEAVVLVNFFNLILFIPLAGMGFATVEWGSIPLSTYSLLLLYGISGGVMFFLLWYRGLTKINANTAALFTGVMPVSTTILAYLFLEESIHVSDVIGMILVIIAIFVGCKKTRFAK